MRIEFEITSEGMTDGHDGGGIAELIFGVFENREFGGFKEDVEADFAIDLDNGPKDIGDCKDDVLVGDIEEACLVFFDPIVGLKGATSRAESGFTSEVDLTRITAEALKHGIPKTDFALKDFADIVENGASDSVRVFFYE
jgi:hypothetical protein